MDKADLAENPATTNQKRQTTSDSPSPKAKSAAEQPLTENTPETPLEPLSDAAKTERTPDILVINYGEYEPDSTIEDNYLPPAPIAEDCDTKQTSPTKPKQSNPDELDEIEFEKYLRIFREKTIAAAKKAKTTAATLRRNSLIRFVNWVEPKLEPYRNLPLPDKQHKKSTKSKSDKQHTATAEPTSPDAVPSVQKLVTNKTEQQPTSMTPDERGEPPTNVPSTEDANQSSSTISEDANNKSFELAEAAPYVPKTINEFLSIMRRTPHSVISPRERHVIATIMNFPNVKVSELMQPAEDITYVNYDEVLGPLTLDRLYRAGYDHFPVVDSRHKIIGLIHTTALNSLEIKETSKAGDLLDPKVYYIREDYSLNQALAAFLRTNCYFFLVIDRYEKIVGLLTYQMLMSYLLGETPEDDFYRDNDRLAVAKRKLA